MPTTMKLIAKSTLGSDAADLTLSNIPATYTDLYVVVAARSTRASSHLGNGKFYFNGSASSITVRNLYASSTSPASDTFTTDSAFQAYWPAASATADTFGSLEIYVPNYAGATNKSISYTCVLENNSSTSSQWMIFASAGLWSSTDAITSITIGNRSADSANLKSGTAVYLYGITKA